MNRHDQDFAPKFVSIVLALSVVLTEAQSDICAVRSLPEELAWHAAVRGTVWSHEFPTKNALMQADIVQWVKVPANNESKELQDELDRQASATSPSADELDTDSPEKSSSKSRNKTAEVRMEPKKPPNSNIISSLVFFFHAPHCPYSTALRPVVECVPLYFPEAKVAFIAQDNTGPAAPNFKSGVIVTPLVKVIDKNETVYTYSGPRRLDAIVSFVKESLGIDPVATPLPVWSKSCSQLPKCYCDFEAHEVSKGELIVAANTVWMFGSVAFLAVVAWQLLFPKTHVD